MGISAFGDQMAPAGGGGRWRPLLPVALILVGVTIAGSLLSPDSPRDSGAILDVETDAPPPPPPPRPERTISEPSEAATAGSVTAAPERPEEVAGSWREMPSAPLESRNRPATAWTGEELIVWGGATESASLFRSSYFNDGAAYSSRTGEWRLLADAPLSPRQGATAVWTGQELLIWGGASASSVYGDGAAYDPVADRWRMLPAAPLPPRQEAAGVWTGAEALVFGGHDLAGPHIDGAAYDPARDIWRGIARRPDTGGHAWSTGALWTGEAAVIWGDDGVTHAYDPAADSWRLLGDLNEWEASVASMVSGGERLYAVANLHSNGRARILRLDEDSGQWQAIGDQGPNTWGYTALWTGRGILVVGEGTVQHLYDTAEDRWVKLPQGPIFDGWWQKALWADDTLLMVAGAPEGVSSSRRSWIFQFDDPGATSASSGAR